VLSAVQRSILAYMTLHNTVEVYRKRSGLTQEELARKVGVTRQTIIAIEKQNYTPSVALALSLSRALGSTVEVLFMLD
jgi:putative transcriptional regulator